MRHLLLTTTAAAALLFGIAGSAGAQSERASGSDRPAASQPQHSPTAQGSSMGERSPSASSKSDRMSESSKSTKSESSQSKSAGNTGEADRSSTHGKSAAGDQSKGSSVHGKAAQDRSMRDSNTGSASREMSDTKDNRRLGQSDERRGKSARHEKAGARQEQSRDQNTGQADRGRSGMSDDQARGDRNKLGDRNERMNDRTGAADRTDARGSASLSTDQRSRVRQALVRDESRARTSVNFSVSIGAHVPDRVRVHRLPASVVEIVPQYRGYDYVVVRDEIVIVEPRTKKVVTVIAKSGGQAGNVGARSTHDSRVSLTAQQKRTIRQHVQMRSADVSGVTVAVGETIPSSVQLETFPQVVLQDVPMVGNYRFFVMNDDIVLVDPSDREIVAVVEE